MHTFFTQLADGHPIHIWTVIQYSLSDLFCVLGTISAVTGVLIMQLLPVHIALATGIHHRHIGFASDLL